MKNLDPMIEGNPVTGMKQLFWFATAVLLWLGTLACTAMMLSK